MSNMEYRQYLTNNSNTIIKNNQSAANIYCSNTLITPDNNILSPPILFNSIYDNPPDYDNNNLKKYFLNIYRTISGMFTPGIRYYI